MNKTRALRLLEIIDDASRRQVSARADSITKGMGTATGQKRYATYENQLDRFKRAMAELKAMIEQNEYQ